MSSVTFSPSVGGDGSTVTDDANPATGLDGGGHRTRFVPALAQVVAVAGTVVSNASAAAGSLAQAQGAATSAATSATNSATSAAAAATSASGSSASASAAAASATSAAASATSAGTAATSAANTLISAVTQRPRITPSLSVDWTTKPTAAALTAAGWTISRAGTMTSLGAVPVKAAENLLVRSQDLNWWNLTTSTVGSVTDESGLVGNTLTATASSGFHAAYAVLTNTNIGSANYRIRVLAKSAGYTKLHIADGSNGRAAAAFDLASGSTIATSFGAGYVSHSIYPHELGGGLYWCEVVLTSATAGTAWSVSIVGYPDTGATLSMYGAQYTGDGISGVEIYAAQLQQGFDGEYVPTTAAPITTYEAPLVTTAANELAYQHDENGVCLGLVQYPPDTNLILQSQDLSNASWLKTEVAVAATKRMWAGNVPFWRVRKTGTSANAPIYQNAATSVAVGAKYTLTVALMGDRWSNVTQAAVGLSGASSLYGVNSESVAAIMSGPGTLTQDTGSRFNVTGLSFDTPTVVRITRTFPAGDTSVGAYIFPDTGASTTIGAAILATRVHLSAAAQMTPYIATTTAAATRGGQAVTFGGSAFSVANNPEQGTLLLKASAEDALNFQAISAQLQSGATVGSGHRSFIGTSLSGPAMRFYSQTNSTAQVDFMYSSVWSSTPAVVAGSYALNSTQSAANGTLTAVDTSCLVPVVDRLTVGTNESNSHRGLIQRTELYPQAMTSAELAAITTPGVL